MAENEINPERIFEVMSLIKKFAKEASEANRVINFNQRELDGKDAELAKARKAFESKQKKCQELTGLIGEHRTVLLSKDQECADLKNDLSILLAPYEERVLQMRTELDELQRKYLAKLKEVMMPDGCSEDACVAAAQNFVERSEKWRLYQEAAGIVKRMRECDPDSQVHGGDIARLFG
jgi:chromosome segregation ATPase